MAEAEDSERKWKMKLKDWGFEKYISSSSMKFIVAKVEKRAREEEKDTVFLHHKLEVASSRIKLFKKKGNVEAISPNSVTPPNISYHTPEYLIEAPELASPPQSLSLYGYHLARLREDELDPPSSNQLQPYGSHVQLSQIQAFSDMPQEEVCYDGDEGYNKMDMNAEYTTEIDNRLFKAEGGHTSYRADSVERCIDPKLLIVVEGPSNSM
ncbi:hypothetical protein N431DRAFT_475704 [Stipitochalara longipes BDJ]|nr:hypothetical protein N431DRAFT_475704 [Stipitochalara longipes BDJ]